MSVRKSCGPCNGNGWISDRRDGCPVCDGAGHVMIDDSNGSYVSCDACRGDGWLENRHNFCTECGGVGKLQKT